MYTPPTRSSTHPQPPRPSVRWADYTTVIDPAAQQLQTRVPAGPSGRYDQAVAHGHRHVSPELQRGTTVDSSTRARVQFSETENHELFYRVNDPPNSLLAQPPTINVILRKEGGRRLGWDLRVSPKKLIKSLGEKTPRYAAVTNVAGVDKMYVEVKGIPGSVKVPPNASVERLLEDVYAFLQSEADYRQDPSSSRETESWMRVGDTDARSSGRPRAKSVRRRVDYLTSFYFDGLSVKCLREGGGGVVLILELGVSNSNML